MLYKYTVHGGTTRTELIVGMTCQAGIGLEENCLSLPICGKFAKRGFQIWFEREIR